MKSDPDAGATPRISDTDIAEIHALADVLATIDEAEDIALDMYRKPLVPEVGARAVEFFQSTRWQSAISKNCGVDPSPVDGS